MLAEASTITYKWKFSFRSPFVFPHNLSNGTDLGHLEDCFETYNDPTAAKNDPAVTYPLCGIELHSFMYGSVSSKRCLRRSTKMDISAGTYDQQV